MFSTYTTYNYIQSSFPLMYSQKILIILIEKQKKHKI